MKRYFSAATLVLSVFMFSASALPALAQASAKQAAPQQQNIAASSKVPELTVEQLNQWTEKLNAYVKLYNRSSRAIDSWKRYQSWVNIKTGPTGKERNIYGLYSTYDDVTKELTPKALAVSKTEPAMGALDKAAADYSVALEQLHPVLTQAYNYYNRKDYSDDKFAKGKELHPKLVEAFTAVEKTRGVFDVELTSVKEQVDQQSLAQIEKADGKKYRWHAKRIMMSSLKAVEALQAVQSKSDLPAFSEKVKTYAAIVHEFDDYMATATDIPSGASMKSAPDSILSYLREARDALEKDNIESFNRYAKNVVSDYNRMVTFSRM